MRTKHLFLVVLFSFPFACGEVVKATDGGVDPSEDGGGQGDGGGPLDVCDRALESPESFTACLSERRCDWMLRCTPRYASHEECLEASASEPELGYFNQYLGHILVEGAEAGVFAIDEELMQRCLESFATSSCKGDDAGGGEACPLSIEGLRGEGESCYQELECGRGGRCARESCGIGTCCPGTCELPVTEGQPCGGEVVCETGLACVDGRCEDGAQGAPCTGDRDCDDGLYCDGVCSPKRTADRPCDRDAMCQGDLQCVAQRCESTSSEGDACDDQCFGAFYCDTGAGICREVPSAAGEDCTAAQECVGAELFCNQGTGRCDPLPGDGAPCTSQGECGVGLVCSMESAPPRCAPLRANGEACTGPLQCASFHCNQATGTCEDFESCYGDGAAPRG